MRSVPVCTAGHVFASIGMGEQARAALRALGAAGVRSDAYDIYRHATRTDPDMRALVLPAESAVLPEGGIRIFHVNGDEVDDVINSIQEKTGNFDDGYNIVVPAWELPRYPSAWRSKLKRFDEVWALSCFIKDSLKNANIESHHVGQSVEMNFGFYLPRRFFGIRESAFVLLCFFDLQSYPARKNPRAVVELYRKFKALRPFDDVQLVLKVRDGEDQASQISRSPRTRSS